MSSSALPAPLVRRRPRAVRPARPAMPARPAVRTRPAAPIAVPARAGTDRPSAAVLWRRRAVAVAILLTVVLALTAAIGRVTSGAFAEPTSQVGGHVVVEPGQTLWDVAVATAPDGMDTRRHLDEVVRLNGLDTAAEVDAWTVVLLPAR
ncbi:hypothetical protein [Egicoccus halophilus]|uniref:LysM domain-containing protein n=1 Tax=Egicoccus halophilus TaxID=1670830 RepID=A0A8J3A895_9ACTN|nr:hypothetical protein [Egicoccus halophilus]GGI06628.1 hypothetical protein GCM10011354_20040 [Egicoccus halophilus]